MNKFEKLYDARRRRHTGDMVAIVETGVTPHRKPHKRREIVAPWIIAVCVELDHGAAIKGSFGDPYLVDSTLKRIAVPVKSLFDLHYAGYIEQVGSDRRWPDWNKPFLLSQKGIDLATQGSS